MTAWERIRARLDALDVALWERATSLAGDCGRGRNVWHNAMIARDHGQPWRDVDYARLRHAIHVDTTLRGRVTTLRAKLWARFGSAQ